jgi:phage tail sheath protein FI
MPATLTFPGVYIEEIPSAVHTITGVATSIAAFVGWAPRGSTTEAVLVQSFLDYQREYGGLDARSLLGYSVSQFFNNGGQQAYVIRLAAGAITKGTGKNQVPTGTGTATEGAVTIPVTGGKLIFTAKNPGAWSGSYAIQIVSPGAGGAGSFDVAVVYAPSGTGVITVESFKNITLTTLASVTSNLVALTSSGTPTAGPASGTYVLTGGTDGNGTDSSDVSVPGATAASATIFTPPSGNTTDGFKFTAKNPGAWGNLLAIGATIQQSDPTKTRFSVNVVALSPDGSLSVLETFNNVSVNAADPSYVVTVMNADSNYVSVAAVGTPTIWLNSPFPPSVTPKPTDPPPGSPPFLTGGFDGLVLDPAQDGTGAGLFMNALNADGTGTGGVRLLDRVDIFNLLCVPGEADAPTIASLQEYCFDKRAFYIVDAPELATTAGLISSGPVGVSAGSLTGRFSINSAYYYPWVEAPDPLIGNRPASFPPCGFVAGIYASTDASRGVWKAPAGIDASLTGVSGLQSVLTDLENGSLNVQAINCLRQFKVYGDVVWGARTLQGNNQAGSQWKYVPIRRLALFLESSLYDGTQWVVFEPNDEPLWGQIRLNVGTFMQGLFLQGAFQGTTPQQAYFVKCDAENNPQSSIDQGIVNILVGFAPLYPAEFVVIQIQQMAGQLQA